jgi:hypothetical protein
MADVRTLASADRKAVDLVSPETGGASSAGLLGATGPHRGGRELQPSVVHVYAPGAVRSTV